VDPTQKWENKKFLSSIFFYFFIFLFLFLFFYLFLMTRNPYKAKPLRVPTLSGEPRTRIKRPLHTDRVILQLRQWAGSKKLFAPKEIRTLDIIGLPQRPRPLPLEPTP
jgi:hypothetical protein